MSQFTNAPTYRLLFFAALYMETGSPMPVDLVIELNTRGIIFEEETLIP